MDQTEVIKLILAAFGLLTGLGIGASVFALQILRKKTEAKREVRLHGLAAKH